MNRPLEDLLPGYQYIKIHSEFEEYFIPDRDQNVQIYTSLGHSLLVEMNNENCVKYSMAPQSYKVVSTHAHKISGWKIFYRLLHSCAPNIGGVNGHVKYDLSTPAFKNVEQIEYFHVRIIRIQQEIMLSG